MSSHYIYIFVAVEKLEKYVPDTPSYLELCIIQMKTNLALVLLNPDMPCPYKQCRSRSF